MTPESFMIFTGTANTRLAVDVVNHLDMSLGKMTVGRFSDGEVMVEVNENVRGKDVFVLQPTCAPTNDNLMEVMVMVDALRRASARRITAAIPYFGYARQDRRPRSARVAISAKIVANMLQVVGVDRVLTMDLHADQIQGFFDIPVDNMFKPPVANRSEPISTDASGPEIRCRCAVFFTGADRVCDWCGRAVAGHGMLRCKLPGVQT